MDGPLPKIFWPFTVWINGSSDLKNFAITRTIFFSHSAVGQNNFGNQIPFFKILIEIGKLCFFIHESNIHSFDIHYRQKSGVIY